MERGREKPKEIDLWMKEEEPAPYAKDEHNRLEQISGDKEARQALPGSRQRRTVRARRITKIKEGAAGVFRNFDEGLGKKLTEEHQEFLRREGHLPTKENH